MYDLLFVMNLLFFLKALQQHTVINGLFVMHDVNAHGFLFIVLCVVVVIILLCCLLCLCCCCCVCYCVCVCCVVVVLCVRVCVLVINELLLVSNAVVKCIVTHRCIGNACLCP